MAFRPPVLGRYFKVHCMIYTFCRSELLQYSTCLGLRASLAATCIQSIQLFDLERTGFLRHCFSGDSQSILRGPYFVPFKCGVLATTWICWHCHRQILPAIITTLRSGVNSVWATVFGRLPSIACGNIVPFKVREPAFAGFLSICSRAASFDPQIRLCHLIRSDSCTARFCFELFRELLSLYNQVSPLKSPAFLCASFVCGYPLVGFSSLVPPSNRFWVFDARFLSINSRIHHGLLPSLEWRVLLKLHSMRSCMLIRISTFRIEMPRSSQLLRPTA